MKIKSKDAIDRLFYLQRNRSDRRVSSLSAFSDLVSRSAGRSSFSLRSALLVKNTFSGNSSSHLARFGTYLLLSHGGFVFSCSQLDLGFVIKYKHSLLLFWSHLCFSYFHTRMCAHRTEQNRAEKGVRRDRSCNR